MRERGRALVYTGFGVSLALNVVLAGLLVFHPFGPPGPDPRLLQARIESLLSSSDRTAFHAAMQSVASDVRRHERAMRAALATTRQAFGARPFDADALRAALAGLRQNWLEMISRFDESLVGAMGAVSADGRGRIAAGIPAPPPDGGDE